MSTRDARMNFSASWTMDIQRDGVQFCRTHEGRVVEAYALVDHRKAAVFVAAIINGFQPPRDLRDQGKPIG